MPMKVINLDRSADRLTQFMARNAHVKEISRFPAIDGLMLDVPALVRRGVINIAIASAYTKGALGCAFSHLALWDEVIRSGEPLTICEDDAIINRQFDAQSADVIAMLPADWEIILWGWNCDHSLLFDLLPGVTTCLAIFQQALLLEGISHFQSQTFYPRPFRLLRAMGTICYSITPRGAQKLKRLCLPIRDMTVRFPLPGRLGEPAEGFMVRNNGLDIMLNDAYQKLNAFLSFPPLVITKNEWSTSTVQR